MNFIKKIKRVIILSVCLGSILTVNPLFKDILFESNPDLTIKNDLKIQTVSRIFIDDSNPDYNWSKTAAENIWCSGLGTLEFPYIIKNITIDAQNLDSGIAIQNSDVYFIIKNCTIYNSSPSISDAGISLQKVDNGRLIENNCFQNSVGILLGTNCTKNNISGNICEDNTNYGIRVWGNCDNNIIHENSLGSEEIYFVAGLILNHDCDFNNISGNFKNSTHGGGIHINYYSNYNNVWNNTISGSGQGIYLRTDCDYNNFTKNILKFNSRNSGILLYDECNYNTISLNEFTADIRLMDNCDYNSLLNNTGNTIELEYCDHNEVKGNTLVSGTVGVQISYSKNNNIINNTVEQKFYGMLLEYDSNENVCRDNKISNCSRGIYITENSVKNHIIDNSFSECDMSSVLVIYGSIDTIIRENVFTHNSIGISARCANTTISNNSLINNYGRGIEIIVNNLNISNNTFRENTNGLVIYGDYHIIQNNTFSLNDYGLKFEVGVEYANVFENNFTNNDYGIFLEDNSDKNNFSKNIICDNSILGAKIDTSDCNDNNFFKNYFTNNGINAGDNGANNNWNNSVIGNYWDDYSGVDMNDDGIGDTPYNISGFAGSHDNYPIWEDGDDLLPSINILAPVTNQFFSNDAPNFIVEINDPNLDSMWYTIDGGLTNITFTTNGTIDQANWTLLDDGVITISFYGNDTSGNCNYNEIIVIKDTLCPIINIISPIPSETFGISSPDFIVQIDDPNLDSMWYTIDGGLTNITFTTNETIDQDNWINIPDGLVTLIFYANDTLGHLNFSQVVVNKLITILEIDIISPTIDQLFGSDAPDFIIEISGGNADSMWYTIDGGLTNITFTTNRTIDQSIWSSQNDGKVTIQFYANNSFDNIFFNEVAVRKDTQVPIISIIKPSTDEVIEFVPAYEITITESNLDTIWYTVDDDNNNITISNLIGIIDQEIWDNLPNGYVTIRFYANDTLGNFNFDEVIVFKDTPSPLPPGIPGYNLFILLGIISMTALISIKFNNHRKIR